METSPSNSKLKILFFINPPALPERHPEFDRCGNAGGGAATESGAEAHALQTLSRLPCAGELAKRLGNGSVLDIDIFVAAGQFCSHWRPSSEWNIRGRRWRWRCDCGRSRPVAVTVKWIADSWRWALRVTSITSSIAGGRLKRNDMSISRPVYVYSIWTAQIASSQPEGLTDGSRRWRRHLR